jgi:crotonobetainyl-CoA:carnitine CoA-transferase CaiB-like acyl-CoA transferase
METTPLSVDSPAPLLGQHTEEILKWLGYGKTEIETLKEKEVVLSALSSTAH